MQLPDDNSIVLADDNDHWCADGAELAVRSVDDARSLVPAVFREGDDSTMRAATLSAWMAGANFIQARAGLVLSAQRTPRHSSGPALDGWAPVYGRRRAPSETDGPYRERLMTPVDMVTPAAIKAAVDALVAQFTTQPATYLEPITGDAMFMGPATVSDPPKPNANVTSNVVPAWQAFIQPAGKRLWANYPDKPTAKTGAYIVPVGGARFWISLPGLPGDSTTAPHTMPLAAPTPLEGPMDFIQGVAGVSGPNQSVVAGAPLGGYQGFLPRASTSLIDAVCSEVEQRKAGGVSSSILFDPFYLTGL